MRVYKEGEKGLQRKKEIGVGVPCKTRMVARTWKREMMRTLPLGMQQCERCGC